MVILVLILFYFIGLTGCTAWLGELFTYNITQLSFSIKFVHQICHCNTALSQMSHFLMTNWSHSFPLCDISSNVKINESSFNTLGFFLMTSKTCPCFFYCVSKMLRHIIRYGIIILFICHIKSVICKGFFRQHII